jgi:hypothetical protein
MVIQFGLIRFRPGRLGLFANRPIERRCLVRFRLAGNGFLFTCGERRRAKGEKAALRHPWLRSPLGLSLPSRQIGAGIINPVQTPIWPLGNPWPWRMPTVGKASECRAAFHRPGATRHPWRDAPFCGHPDRAPAPFTPPLGPTDGLEFWFNRHKQKRV